MKKGYWKQIRWNIFSLTFGNELLRFDSYENLYQYCVFYKIDATQV